MSYLNDVLGYRKDLLINRSVVKRENYALLEPDGLVKNIIPGFEQCDVTILSSPKLGASFVDYLVTLQKGAKNTAGFGGEEIEVFFYLFQGKVKVWNGEKEEILTDGGFFYCPAGERLSFKNLAEEGKAFLYKRRYLRVKGVSAYTVSGNVSDLEWKEYEGMKDVLILDFLPALGNLGFDMNFHILKFRPGASHGYVETHFQEHGAYIYSGEGMYNLDNDWVPVKKGDYLFMGAYCLQAAYAVGREEDFAYIYSKDCNRDVEL